MKDMAHKLHRIRVKIGTIPNIVKISTERIQRVIDRNKVRHEKVISHAGVWLTKPGSIIKRQK